MLFALGFIAGLVVAVLIAVLALIFRKPVHQIMVPLVKNIERAAPGAKGFIVDAKDDATTVREEVIARNSAEGKDTPIAELL